MLLVPLCQCQHRSRLQTLQLCYHDRDWLLPSGAANFGSAAAGPAGSVPTSLQCCCNPGYGARKPELALVICMHSTMSWVKYVGAPKRGLANTRPAIPYATPNVIFQQYACVWIHYTAKMSGSRVYVWVHVVGTVYCFSSCPTM